MPFSFSFRRKKPTELEKAKENLASQYNGHHHRSSGMRFQRPFIKPESVDDRMLELENSEQTYCKQAYMNANGENDHEKYPDLDTYYSSNKEYPRRLVVQATQEVHKETDCHPRHWGRRRIRGRVPFIITLAELCLNPFRFRRYDGAPVDEDEEEGTTRTQKEENVVLRTIKRIIHWITSTFLTLTLAWIIQVMLSVEIVTSPWNDDGSTEPYDEYENVHWFWPKHSVNVLDQSPENKQPQSKVAKLTVPRRLVIKDQATGQWVPKKTVELRDKKTGMLQPYIFLSFSRANYLDKTNNELRQILYLVAERMLEHENAYRDPQEPPMEAFWVDVDCVSSDTSIPVGSTESKCTRDVNTICDAVRCAKRVYIVLPSDSEEDKQIWGNRIWTFPEVLLAANKTRYCFTHSGSEALFTPHEVTLSDMYNSFWPEISRLPGSDPTDSDGQLEHEDAIGYLVSHYTNSIQLSELQLFTFAVQAMARQTTSIDTQGYTTRDMAYAAMGLLSYRLTPNDSDNTFQAIARLSLVNDSNQLLERLLCLWPYPQKNPPPIQTQLDYASAGSETLLRNIADRDQYSTHLWDIKPLCDIVGVGDDLYEPTVIMDRCRGIPIRWKDFPRLRYAKELKGLGATVSQTIVYFGVWFLATGFGLFSSAIALALALTDNSSGQTTTDQTMRNLIQYLQQTIVPQYLLGIALYFGVAWVISWFSPWAVRQLCNGGSKGSSSHLVGFEGTMSLHDLEKAIYGNFNNRLSYAASSTVFSKNMRHSKIRMGREPDDQNYWKNEMRRLHFPDTHRLFTIVDTGDMTVSVIAAERPPVVALICGREGGMLRALLCSWRFEKNCLYRESVVRMRSSLEEQATHNDWLKISLASQGDVNRTRVSHLKQQRAKQSQSPLSKPSSLFTKTSAPHISIVKLNDQAHSRHDTTI
jgi:hypothetical protein